MAHVFISYSSKHRDLTQQFVELLERENYTVWWDYALESWESYEAQIREALTGAAVVVVIWSEGAVASDWVYSEAKRAGDAGKLVNALPKGEPRSNVRQPFDVYHADRLDLAEPYRLLRSIRTAWEGKARLTTKPLHEHYRETYDLDLFETKRMPPPADKSRMTPSDLLQARREIADFVDASGAAAEMMQWCAAADVPLAGRLIHGAGGFGKTRLMIEVAKRLRAQGWLAGFLPPTPLDVEHEREAKARRQALQQVFAAGDEPGVFLVVDYAEGRREEVKRLAQLMAARREEATRPVRLVLLARGNMWWKDLFEGEAAIRAVFGGAGDVGDVQRIGEVPAGQARMDVFYEAGAKLLPYVHALVEKGRLPGLNRDAPTEATFNRLAHDPVYSRPLFLQIEALLHLCSARPEGDQGGVETLLAAVLGLERTFWRNVLKPFDDTARRDLDRGLAQVTVVQGVETTAAAQALLMADRFYGSRTAPDSVDGVRRNLALLYGRGGEAIGFLEPDLIGEHQICQTADAELLDGCLAWIAAEPDAQKRAARLTSLLTVLQRATRAEHGAAAQGRAKALIDHAILEHGEMLAKPMVAVMQETPGGMFGRLEAMVEQLPVEVLGALNAALPLQYVSWSEFSLRVAERYAAAVRSWRIAEASDMADEQRHRLLNRAAAALGILGMRLSSVGRREDALGASLEAVDIRRALANDRPDAFSADLASSLNNLAIRFSNLGWRDDALTVAQEAVDMYRALVENRSDDFLPDLAGSLNNLGAMFFDLGRREEALKTSQEAVDIYRALAKKRPDAFFPDLAGGLNNLGSMLSELGRREEALVCSQEAVDIRRALATVRPDAFLPDLASSLNNLGNRFSGLGQREDALKAVQEAADIYRALAKDRPAAFLPFLGACLNNLSGPLAKLGRGKEALDAAQEAVDIRRMLVKDRPDAFLPDLAGSLNNFGVRLSEFGRSDEALEASQEAIDIYRALARDRPDAFSPELARSLNNISIDFLKLGRRDDALATVQEAIEMRRALAKAQPDAFLPDLATSISVLSDVLTALERHDEAATAARDALSIMLPFIERYPENFRKLARTMSNDFVTYSQAAGIEPDPLLLKRVSAALGGAVLDPATIPDELVATVFANPEARDFLQKIGEAIEQRGPPADWPNETKQAVIALMIERGMLQLGQSSGES